MNGKGVAGYGGRQSPKRRIKKEHIGLAGGTHWQVLPASRGSYLSLCQDDRGFNGILNCLKYVSISSKSLSC